MSATCACRCGIIKFNAVSLTLLPRMVGSILSTVEEIAAGRESAVGELGFGVH